MKDRLSDWYGESKKIGSNFLGWCADAPVVVKALVLITGGLFGWLLLVGYLPKPKSVARGTGVVLQLFGFVLAAYGLERTLEEFGQVPSTSRILPWLSDFAGVFDTNRVVSVSASGTIPVSGTAELSVVEPESESKTLEERVERLEEQVEDVREEIGDIRRHVDSEVKRLGNKIEEEVEAVEEEVQEVREKVKEVNVGEGALWLEWCAVFSFIYGVPLASFPASFLPAYRVLIIPIVAGTLRYLLHWYAD